MAVELGPASGIDLDSGSYWAAALHAVDVVIDVSEPISPEESTDITDVLASASYNLVTGCARHGVRRLVVLTMAGIEESIFGDVPYYVGKRVAKEIVLAGPVPATIVKSTQWHEFATSPSAVTCGDDEVVVEDWLIQPIAADVVADVVVEAGLAQTRAPRIVTGPQPIRLPEPASKLLAAHDDQRRVRPVQPVTAGLAEGALLGRQNAMVLGPDVETWLNHQTAADPTASPALDPPSGLAFGERSK
ncbi:LysR family transcriptional regulator [Mycobacterium simiae]|nr:LysR family transcriptional regulator [Mycobacterium simiae]